MIIIGFVITVVGCALGAYLDVHRKVKNPPLHFAIGVITGMFSVIFILYGASKG